MSFFSNITQFGLPGLLGIGSRNKNPANAAMPYLNQIPGMAQQNLSPYIQQGNQAQGVLDDLYAPNNEVSEGFRPMANNPLEYVNSIMRGYQPSEGYKYKENRLRNAMTNSAAAGGFAGTQNDQENQAQTLNGILGEDMQQFLANILGAQQTGLGGLERMMSGRERTMENTANRGFNAASDLSNILGSNLGQQAGYGFQGSRQKMQNSNNQRQLLAQLAGMFM